MLNSNFGETVRDFIASDKTFTLMNCIKVTPVDWKNFLAGVLVMVKQLEVPKCFVTLSSAELRWN